MPTVTVKIAGIDDVAGRLRALPEKIGARILRGSVTRAADIGVAAVAATAADPSGGRGKPRRKPPTGALARSVAKKVRSYENSTVIWAGVGPTRDDGAHGWMVEKGHRMVVGGSVNRLDRQGRERPGTAAVQRKGRFKEWRVLLGNNSRGRSRRNALIRYLAGVDRNARITAAVTNSRTYTDNLTQLLSDVRHAVLTHEESTLLEGAVKTGGMYSRWQGKRGEGSVVGAVPGYPFVRPAFDRSGEAMLQTIIDDLRSKLPETIAS